jgi:hypothetical protein
MMTEAQQRHVYSEVRKRLWNAPAVRVTEKLEPMVRMITAPKPVIKPKPALVWVRQFNAHVIAYRRWQLAQETGTEYVEQVDRPRVEEIILSVLADFPDVTLSEIKGPRRDKRIRRPRQLAMYEVYRQRPDLSFPAMGRIFSRDHTTILHSVRKMSAEFGPARVSFISCPRSA